MSPTSPMGALGGPRAIYNFVFVADSEDSWGGWFVAPTGAFMAGAQLRTEAGAYTVLTQVGDGFDGSLFGLENGQVFVEWYRSGQAEQFLPTRNGSGLPAGSGGLGSELDHAWTAEGWLPFGEGGRQQARLPSREEDPRFTGVFDALSGARWGDLLFNAGAAGQPTGPGMAALAGGYHDDADQRDLPIQGTTSGADGATGLGGEVAATSTATAFIPFGPEGTWQAEGPPTGLVVGHAFPPDLERWISHERPPRSLTAMDGDGRLALAHADGGFGTPGPVHEESGYDSGAPTQEELPRLLADANGDGRADAVGFRPPGVWGDAHMWLG